MDCVDDCEYRERLYDAYADLQEALEENAKLRKERDRLLMNANPTANELRRVRAAWEKDRAENAKLRELVRELMAFVEDDDACEHCGHDADCVEAADGELVLPYEGRCLMRDVFDNRMRELGIEVDV